MTYDTEVLRAMPAELLERSTNPGIQKARNRRLEAWLAERRATPTLADIEAERRRRRTQAAIDQVYREIRLAAVGRGAGVHRK